MDIEPIHSTINSEYTDQGLQDGVYYYVITAVSATGESIPSNCCFVTVVKPTIPGYSIAILSILGLICLVVVVKVNKNKIPYEGNIYRQSCMIITVTSYKTV